MPPRARNKQAPTNRVPAKLASRVQSKTASPSKTPAQQQAEDETITGNAIPLEHQQRLLNVFSLAFSNLLSLESLTTTLQPLLQEVKQHLYNRAFDKAFGREEYLEAYAARWSSSRALGYLQIFREVIEHLTEDTVDGSSSQPNVQLKQPIRQLKTVCLGGGAGAEVCALAGLHRLVSERSDDEPTVVENAMFSQQVTAIDIAKWSPTLDKLHRTLTTPPVLSKYASEAARVANVEIVQSSSFNVEFIQYDLLALAAASAQSAQCFRKHVEEANLITLMFTLNELYTVSMPATQKFLFELTAVARTGALLLVVDSPGSYSTVTINGQEKRYPMHWLMDHTLLGPTTKSTEPVVGTIDAKPIRTAESLLKWEKLVTDESRWFRLPASLKYPLDLENMRYQLHLYRRL